MSSLFAAYQGWSDDEFALETAAAAVGAVSDEGQLVSSDSNIVDDVLSCACRILGPLVESAFAPDSGGCFEPAIGTANANRWVQQRLKR